MRLRIDHGPMATKRSGRSVPLTDSATTKRPRSRIIVNKRIAPYVFLFPFILLFTIFLVIPLLYAFDLSLYKSALVGGTRFVWFDNYAKAFTDPNFWDGVLTLFKFGAMQIPVMLILALMFALILDSGVVYAKSFFRISFFLPMPSRL